MRTRNIGQSLLLMIFLLSGGLGFDCDAPTAYDHPEKDVLTLTAQIPLPGVSGRIDHIAYDAANHLAFVAALGNNTVEVVDIVADKAIHTISGLHEPQGIAYIPSLHRLAVANGNDGTCLFFDTHNYIQLGSVDLKDDADNIRYDEASGLLYVGYGSGGIAVIDATAMKQVANIPLDGHPESFQLDKKNNAIYINIPDRNKKIVASITAHSVIDTWKNTKASANFPMAFDEANSHLFVGCRNNATLEVLNSMTGNMITSLYCSGDADDVFYDAADSLVFVSAGKGFIDVFKTKDKSSFEQINHIETRSGARTSLWLPEEKKLLLAVPAHESKDAALWIYAFSR